MVVLEGLLIQWGLIGFGVGSVSTGKRLSWWPERMPRARSDSVGQVSLVPANMSVTGAAGS